MSVLLTGGVLGLLVPGVARADSAPATPSPRTPVTAAADALPTVQVNDVVWAQTVVGNTVYAVGKFTSARPAGAPAGTSETVRNRFLAYDIRTGALVPSFAPDLNAQALTVAASPDGSRVYVGGDFSAANGQTRYRVAAYSTSTGALISTFHPSVNGRVWAITATNTTVYFGGTFTAVGSAARTGLAAVRASDGGVLPWAPVPGTGPTDRNSDPSKTPAQNQATSNAVLAMVVTGGGSQVVVGGRFDSLNGDKATGVGALDAVTGATRPFAVNQLITNQGVNSAVFSLTTDGTTVYGTAYDFYGPGNLEGAFEVTADGGNIIEIDDCHGDTYSSFATSGVLYLSSHAHDCGNIGGFPEENPRINKFATAFTTTPTGTVGPNTEENANFVGQPAPSLLPWFPTLTPGTWTGQSQAGWSVAGNSQYVVYGGEFPKVNGVAQAGLVRFAVPSIAPNKVGPNSNDGLTPTVVSLDAGTMRVSWQATWDQDNENLTYKVTRSDQPSTPVYQTTAGSTFWNRPAMGFIDRTVKAGSTYSYRVTAFDPFGNSASRATGSATVSTDSAATGPYSDTVLADHPAHYWRMDEATGSTTAYDHAAFADLAVGSGVTDGVSGALAGSTDTAAAFDGTSNGSAATTAAVQGPQVFSEEAWFNTTTTSGGKIVGFGNQPTGESNNYDRHVYMDDSGQLHFGTWLGYQATIDSSASYNDGAWHHVVGTVGPAGIAMYVDGQLIGQRSETGAQDYMGYWRVGGDNRWAGSSDWFDGRIDEVAIYGTALTGQQVQRHYAVGSTGQPYNEPPTASFTASTSGMTASVDGSGSTDTDGTVASYTWDFGDGSTATGAKAGHTYTTAGSHRIVLTVTDNGGKTGTASRVVGVSPTGTVGGAYSAAVRSDGASHHWRLGEASGAALDSIGTDDLGVGSGVTRPVSGAVAGDADTAAAFSGDQNGLAAEQAPAQAPNTFSLEAWFRTTSTSGGKIVGFGNTNSGLSSNYDRHIYLDGSGRLYFGVWTGSMSTVQSSPGYNDGSWHHVVATLGASGEALMVDGAVVDSRSDITSGQNFSGYWRIGGDSSWAGSNWFAGNIDDVAFYPTVLTAAQAAQHHDLGATAAPVNSAPTASFTSSVSNLAASFDGSASADSDGTVAGYAWTFGDGTSGTGATPSHTYAAAGTYSVTLTVTDDKGATGSVTHPVTVTAPNAAPTASFTFAVNQLAASFNGSASSDPDGTVAGYAWSFGDGTSGTGATPSHTYAAAGSYPVTLTVTDDKGATGTVTHSVVVSVPNAAPTASFTSSVSNLAASFDGSASADSDGTVAGYVWNFGDGTSGTGVKPSHTYAAAGTYSVTLTVTDDKGATGSVTHSVTVTGTPPLASDAFGRTTTSGFGTADVGGAWTVSGATGSTSVSGGVGNLRVATAGASVSAYLNSVAVTDVAVQTEFSLAAMPTGGGTYLSLVGRHVGSTDYRAVLRVNPTGSATITLSRFVAGVETKLSAVTVPNLTYTAGTVLVVRLDISGTGTSALKAKVWVQGAVEPTTWQVSAQDSTADLQRAGGLGVIAYASGTSTALPVRVTVDNLWAGRSGSTPAA